VRTLRGFWRSLTSMRTALILLLFLAVAAVPGSVLPQRSVSRENVNAYLASHPGVGPWLDRLWFFDVYASPWFSAIYLLLFISLVGCLVPRLRQHIGNLLAKPPDAPARLDRLPHSALRETTREVTAGTTREATGEDGLDAASVLRQQLRRQRWRTVVRERDGTVTVSAEKGYLKETGNLIFHFALLALLVGVALGSGFGWHGNRLLVAGEDFAFCNTVQQYDEYALGPRITAGDLPPFCVTLNTFHAEYLDDGQPVRYSADISYVEGLDGARRPWRLEVNSPLRLDGANVYLLGHGYAPELRYTDRYGVTQTTVAPFLPDDAMLTSSGVAKFPEANVDPTGRKPRDPTSQVAFAGVYAPTLPSHPDAARSAFPAERDPALMLGAYVGNLGLGSGLPQSVYALSDQQIASGELRKVGERMLRPGETWTLPDGSAVQFVGTRQWVTVSVRQDPGEALVLAGAGALLVGLMVSLSGKRRRLWARITPAGDGRSLISFGGLPRSDYPGFAEEFDRVVALTGGHDSRQPVAVGEKGP
jgi:cytochrome c biogenesis protein